MMEIATVQCSDCECRIEDAEDVHRLLSISNCVRATNVQLLFYGYNDRYLGRTTTSGCCYGTARVTYTPGTVNK